MFLAGCGGGSSTGPTASAYEIELIWLGTPPSAQVQAAFETAESRTESIITGAVRRVSLPGSFTNLSQCGLPGHPDISRADIDGLRIYAVIEAIDSVGGVLGSAGPCAVRPNEQPALGVMRFDSFDVNNLLAQGRLTSVILHEMLHVVGVGTVWLDKALLDTLTNPADARFTGVDARTACATLNGGTGPCATSVPVHSTDGAGSRFSHWREGTFASELMTPFLGGGATPLSAMTIGSLSDLDYEVDFDAADAYTVPPPPTPVMLRDGGPSAPGIQLPEPMRPKWKIDGAGRLVPYRPRR
jgi:hypothetical protein